jgi:translation initiation factor 4E
MTEEPVKRSFFDAEEISGGVALEPSSSESVEQDVIALIESGIAEQQEQERGSEARVEYGLGDDEHKLSNSWTFWYKKRIQGPRTAENYAKSIKYIGTVSSVEAMWGCYAHMIRPNDLPNTSDYQLFLDGVKPVWEDEQNKLGGKWTIRLRKGWASKVWEDAVLALAGGVFGDELGVVGAVVSIRYQEDFISFWNRNALDDEAKVRALQTIRNALNIPPSVAVDYKPHDQSIKNSSRSSSSAPATSTGDAAATSTAEADSFFDPASFAADSNSSNNNGGFRSRGGGNSNRRYNSSSSSSSSNNSNDGSRGGGRNNQNRRRDNGWNDRASNTRWTRW